MGEAVAKLARRPAPRAAASGRERAVFTGQFVAPRRARHRVRREITAEGKTLAEVVELYKWEKK